MFRILGVLLAAYIAYCLVTGSVYAKYGAWGRTFHRQDDGEGYWGAIGSYAALVIMLFFLF